MRRAINKTLLASSILLALGSQAAFATNGIEATGLGQVHKAMGGAAVGNPYNTTSIATNPASISNIEAGYDLGVEVFQPNRSGTRLSDGQKFEGNETKNFLIPEGAFKSSKSGEKYSYGVAVYGAGGMNTDFSGTNPPTLNGNPFNVGGAGENPGINLEQLNISPTLGIKLSDKHSIGVSANIVYQQFEAKGLSLFKNPGFTVDPTAVSDVGSDSSTGVGATIGWQGKVSDTVTLGATYRSKVDMGKLDKYKGLITNGGDLDLPAALSVGASIKATPKTTVAVDVKHIYYSDVPAFANEARIVPGTTRIGGDVGFGWKDQTVLKLGVKHEATPKLSLMGGINYGKNPVSNKGTNLNLLAPAITERHISAGFEYKLDNKSSIAGSYVRTLPATLKGDATTAPIPQQYDLHMGQNAIGIGYSRQF